MTEEKPGPGGGSPGSQGAATKEEMALWCGGDEEGRAHAERCIWNWGLTDAPPHRAWSNIQVHSLRHTEQRGRAEPPSLTGLVDWFNGSVRHTSTSRSAGFQSSPLFLLIIVVIKVFN